MNGEVVPVHSIDRLLEELLHLFLFCVRLTVTQMFGWEG